MNKYFFNILGLDSLKQKYKELAKKLHPDLGGNAEEFKAMRAEFEEVFYKFNGEDNKERPGQLTGLLDKLIFLFNLPGVGIDIVGRWLWVSFENKPETIVIDKLKEAGLRWSNKQKKWYSGGENFKYKPIKSGLNYSEIVARHGRQEYKGQGLKGLEN
jgi:curved DNA-binding protein CbpA